MAKYALVTGGSRGIGRAVAVRLASEGFNVLINYVSNDAAAAEALEAVRAAGGDGELMKFNVGDPEAAAQAIGAWQAAHPDEGQQIFAQHIERSQRPGGREIKLFAQLGFSRAVLRAGVDSHGICNSGCFNDRFQKRQPFLL